MDIDELIEKYNKHFKEGISMRMIPASISEDAPKLKELIKQCIDSNKTVVEYLNIEIKEGILY